MATTVIFLTTTGAGHTWSVPSDWNNTANSIEVIGGGGGAAGGYDTGPGGAGGGYAKISNLTLTPGANISYTVGIGGAGGTGSNDGGAGGSTFFNGTTLGTSSVGSTGGAAGTSDLSSPLGGTGHGTGATTHTGGSGGNSQNSGFGGAGGGGAAGPRGNGGGGAAESTSGTSKGGNGGGGAGGGGAGTVGASASSTTTNSGSAGGNNAAGTGSGSGSTSTSTAGGTGTAGGGGGGGAGGSTVVSNGGAGGAGADWTQTSDSAVAGAGGGGGGSGGNNSSTNISAKHGGAGGLYGGGGGAGGAATATANAAAGAAGAQGIIVITYTPSSAPTYTQSLSGGLSFTGSLSKNTDPSAPTLSSPANAATGVSTTPALAFSTTDPDSDNVSYEVEVATDSSFTTSASSGVVDSYSETNQDSVIAVNGAAGGQWLAWGQSFTGNGGILGSAEFYLKQSGSITGNAYAKIYAHSGTYGTSSVGTGSPLATSDVFDVSVLTSSFVLSTFNFSGANKITLTNGTNYVVVFEYSGSSLGPNAVIGYDGSSPTASGNACSYSSGPTWTTHATVDTCFYINSTSVIDTLDGSISGNFSFGSGGGNPDKRGFQFTASQSYSLGTLSVELMKAGTPTDNLQLTIHTGSMTGTTVATSNTVAGSTLATSASFIDFAFSSPPALTSGTTYYVEIARSGANDAANYYEQNVSNNGSSAGNAWSYSTGTWTNLTSFDGNYKAQTVGSVIIDALSASGGHDTAQFADTTTGHTADTDPFPSGDSISFTVPSGEILTGGTTYYWRARAKDPSGTNTWSPWSSTYSFTASSGGTTYNKSLTAGLTPTGARNATTSRAITAALSFAGSISKFPLKALTATQSFTGAISRAISRPFTASTSFSTVFLYQADVIMTATLTMTGNVVHLPSKVMTGSISPSGAIKRAISRPFSASLGFVGSFKRATIRALTAGLNFAGTFAKLPKKALTAGLSYSTVFIYQADVIMTATLNFSGSIARSTGRKLTGGLSFAGNIVKRIPKSITAALSFTGSITGIKIAIKALSGALSFSGSVTRTTGKALNAATNFAGSIVRSTQHSFMAQLDYQNSLLNGSYEGPVNGDIAQYYSSTITIDTAQIYEGNSALKVVTISSSNPAGMIHWCPISVNLQAGTVVERMSMWVWVPTGTSVIVSNRIAPGGSHGYIGEGTVNTTITGNNTWQQAVLSAWTYTSAAFTPGIQVHLTSSAAGVTLYCDNAEITIGTVSKGIMRLFAAYLNPTAGTNNLEKWSQGAFSAHWSHNLSSNVTITDNSLVAPDGTTTASQFTANANTSGAWSNPVVPANVTVTVSVYMSYVSGATTWQVGTDKANVRFNVQTGAFVGQSTSGGGILVGYNIENVGSGWFRFEVTYINPTAGAAFTLYSQSGSTSTTIGVWGAQSEIGSSATGYVPTSGATAYGNDQLTKQTNKLLAAILSFSSVFTYLAEVIMTAALNMVGSTAKSTSRSIAAILSFVGGFTGTKFASSVQNLTATLSLTGNTVKYTPKAFAGVLNFNGSFLKQAGKVISAGLTFVGTHARMHIFYKALTASLSFTGSMSKRIQKALTSTLSFVGAQIRDYITVFLHPIDIAFVLLDSLLFTLKMPGALAFTVNKPVTLNTTMNMPLPLEFTVITGANILITFVVVPVISVTVVVPAPLAFKISK